MIFNIFNKIFNKGLPKHLIKSATLSGKACLLKNELNYENFKNINEAELKIFSQNGEDGIIDFLLFKLSIKNPKFIEIGVENYDESNTRFLYESCDSQGLIIDGSFDLEELKNKLEYWKGRISLVNKFITTYNINPILEKENFNNNLDIFSIDIDVIDYCIIKKLPKKISKIFIAEYNPVFGPDLEITTPNQNSFDRTKYHYSNLCWGMSLKALIKLMISKGYFFVGTNLFKNNAFFIMNDYQDNFTTLTKNIDLNDLANYTNHSFMESRDQNSKLTYLNKDQQIKKIRDCEVVDLSREKEKLIKLKELI
jgi:hypothetical protein